MKKIAKKNKKIPTADEIAEMADAGHDISVHFTGKGKMVKPIQRVNVDFTTEMLNELDTTALSLNVSRQAVIKVLLRHALDQHYIAQQARKSGLLHF